EDYDSIEGVAPGGGAGLIQANEILTDGDVARRGALNENPVPVVCRDGIAHPARRAPDAGVVGAGGDHDAVGAVAQRGGAGLIQADEVGLDCRARSTCGENVDSFAAVAGDDVAGTAEGTADAA